jgi:hypothetical protein
MTTEPTAKDLRAAARSRFFFLGTEQAISRDLQALVERSCAPYREVGDSFLSALAAAVSTLEMPATLAMASVCDIDFRLESIQELIKSGADPDHEQWPAARDEAYTRVQHRLAEQIKGERGDKLADATCHFLLKADELPQFHDACSELLRQGAVLIWGGFEAFAREILVRFLDANPTVALDLLASPNGRRLFGVRSLDFELLREVGFDLSGQMGRVLAGFHDLSSLQALKSATAALFPDDGALRKALDARELWVLSQRRHVIVHRRGVVDQKYLDATGDALAVGERLMVSPQEIYGYLETVQRGGVALLKIVQGMEGGEQGGEADKA